MLVHAVERDAGGGATVRSAVVCRMLAREGDWLTAFKQSIDRQHDDCRLGTVQVFCACEEYRLYLSYLMCCFVSFVLWRQGSCGNYASVTACIALTLLLSGNRKSKQLQRSGGARSCTVLYTCRPTAPAPNFPSP